MTEENKYAIPAHVLELTGEERKMALRKLAYQRTRARSRGEDVPKLLRGPKKGHKQPASIVIGRKKFGPDHHHWNHHPTAITGSSRARNKYQDIGPCVRCGAERSERHHRDGNTLNNEPDNIRILCRRCHMTEDGRLEKFRELQKVVYGKGVAAARRKKINHG